MDSANLKKPVCSQFFVTEGCLLMQITNSHRHTIFGPKDQMCCKLWPVNRLPSEEWDTRKCQLGGEQDGGPSTPHSSTLLAPLNEFPCAFIPRWGVSALSQQPVGHTLNQPATSKFMFITADYGGLSGFVSCFWSEALSFKFCSVLPCCFCFVSFCFFGGFFFWTRQCDQRCLPLPR